MAKDPYKYFRIEARELLEGMTQGVLALERGGPTKETVGGLLRIAHTLKGASRVVKRVEIAGHAHALEELLVPYREGTPLPPSQVNELLRLLDAIAKGVNLIDPAAPDKREKAGAVPDEPLETVRVEIGDMDRLLESVSEATVQMHSLSLENAAIERLRHVASVLADRLSPRRASEYAGPGASVAVGKAYALAEEVSAALDRLQRDVGRGLDRVGGELAQVRDTANRLRLLPASTIFPSLQRAARDAADGLGQRVTFTASGAGRLDGHVLAALRDALLHAVRNAVAHGLEPESERVAAGKDPTGHINLEVFRRGAQVAFVCRDDGRGVDVGALRTALVARGQLSPLAVAALSEDALYQLVFAGGVSTSGTTTQLSGRGIGLDAIREITERLRGKVSLRSQKGRGTTLEICVPVSLSSVNALLVESAGTTVSIPLDAVERTMRIADSEVVTSAGRATLVFDNQPIPFVALSRVLGRPGTEAPGRRQGSVVIVRSGQSTAALGVDRLRGTENVIVRPLPSNADVDDVIAGASLDAEGNPQLVLDPAGFVAAAAEMSEAVPLTASQLRRPLLVVDDSLTTRMLEQSILESAGYEVHLATSAEEALAKAKDRNYALFVVDVEMPGMNGFEFVAATQADPRLREIPTILVTSLGSPEDRERGRDAGARAHIVKGEFDQGYLLQTIRELIG